jgi:hypothetical protein
MNASSWVHHVVHPHGYSMRLIPVRLQAGRPPSTWRSTTSFAAACLGTTPCTAALLLWDYLHIAGSTAPLDSSVRQLPVLVKPQSLARCMLLRNFVNP